MFSAVTDAVVAAELFAVLAEQAGAHVLVVAAELAGVGIKAAGGGAGGLEGFGLVVPEGLEGMDRGAAVGAHVLATILAEGDSTLDLFHAVIAGVTHLSFLSTIWYCLYLLIVLFIIIMLVFRTKKYCFFT